MRVDFVIAIGEDVSRKNYAAKLFALVVHSKCRGSKRTPDDARNLSIETIA